MVRLQERQGNPICSKDDDHSGSAARQDGPRRKAKELISACGNMFYESTRPLQADLARLDTAHTYSPGSSTVLACAKARTVQNFLSLMMVFSGHRNDGRMVGDPLDEVQCH
jgi:hypothetical protein